MEYLIILKNKGYVCLEWSSVCAYFPKRNSVREKRYVVGHLGSISSRSVVVSFCRQYGPGRLQTCGAGAGEDVRDRIYLDVRDSGRFFG